MKCPNCRSCVRLVRVEHEGKTFLDWYCNLCEESFEMVSKKYVDKDSELFIKIKNKYMEMYGKAI